MPYYVTIFARPCSSLDSLLASRMSLGLEYCGGCFLSDVAHHLINVSMSCRSFCPLQGAPHWSCTVSQHQTIAHTASTHNTRNDLNRKGKRAHAGRRRQHRPALGNGSDPIRRSSAELFVLSLVVIIVAAQVSQRCGSHIPAGRRPPPLGRPQHLRLPGAVACCSGIESFGETTAW